MVAPVAFCTPKWNSENQGVGAIQEARTPVWRSPSPPNMRECTTGWSIQSHE